MHRISKEILEESFKQGKDVRQVALENDLSVMWVYHLCKKFGVRTPHSHKQYNIQEIQNDYDQNNFSWRDLQNKYGVSCHLLIKWQRSGLFNSRNRLEGIILYNKFHAGRAHSPETKEKISKSRIKYLQENPDKVPYLINHSSKQSYPEKLFQNALEDSKIEGWIYRFRSGIYEYDFAFPDKKIDIEIDGGTHNTEKVKKIDARRDKFSVDNGWIVIRFTDRQVKQNIIQCIDTIKNLLVK